jgi:hypothetical protein
MRRRRIWTIVAAVALVAAVAASSVAAFGGNGKKHNATTTTSVPKSTTPVIPTSYHVGVQTFFWDETGTGVYHVGPTGQQLPGRVLTTQVRYPTITGRAASETPNALPATAGGPFPVIVFAHGFETVPIDYASLLDAWVAAGFVVVTPIFPDENSHAVQVAGGDSNTSIATNLEADQFNEPGDIVYVLKQLGTLSSQPADQALVKAMNLSDVGLAGQSDGADVVAALPFASAESQLYKSFPTLPKAVAVLSGAAWGAHGTYASSSSSPALLQIQSDADGCVSPSLALDMFATLQSGAEPKWFVTLLGADHLGPYEGFAPYAPVIVAVTTDFFKLELDWRAKSLTPASILAAGHVADVAQTSTTVNENTMPIVASNGGCGIPS